MKIKTINMLFLLFVMGTFLFGTRVVSLPDVQRGNELAVDGDNVYIADMQSVCIYSLKDFKMVKRFGKQGEGPGEFSGYITLSLSGDNLIINSPSKVSWFSKTGELIKEARVQYFSFIPLGKNFASIGFARDKDTGIAYETVNIYDAEFKKLKELFREENWAQKVGEKFTFHVLNFYGLFFFSYKDKLYVGAKGGVIRVYDENGNELYSITPKFEKIKVTDADKNRYLDFLKTDYRWKDRYEQVKSGLIFDDYFPERRRFYVADDKIYMFTYKRKDDKYQCLVFDLKGKLLTEAYIPMADQNPTLPYPFSICNGKLYQLVDNAEAEMWELHIEDMK